VRAACIFTEFFFIFVAVPKLQFLEQLPWG